MAKVELPGWSAMQHGLEPGKHPESLVEVITGKNNNTFKLFRIFKPYIDQRENSPTKGQWLKGGSFGLTPETMTAIVDRINHLIGNFMQGTMNGHFVFQPGNNPYFKPPVQQQQYPQQQGYPQQAPQQQYASPPAQQYQVQQGYPGTAPGGAVQYGAPPPGYQQPPANGQQQMFQQPPQGLPPGHYAVPPQQPYYPPQQPQQAAPQEAPPSQPQYPPGYYQPPQS